MSRFFQNKFLYWAIVVFLFSTSVQGDVVDLDYSLNLESHSQAEDQVFSDFSFEFENQYVSQRFSAEIDLTSDLVYDHESENDSTLWEGAFHTRYNFSHSLYWLLDTELSELNLEGNDDFDEFNSQTLSNTTTGFRYSLDQVMRGNFSVSLLTRLYSYEESTIDATENLFLLAYEYPLDQFSAITTSYSVTEQKYDSLTHSINDADNNIFRIDYYRQFSRLTIGIYAENNDIEFVNQISENSTDAFGLNLNYQINQSSQILLSWGNDVVQSYALNTTIIDPSNPVLISGLVTNKQYSIQYSKNEQFYNMMLQIYQNDIEDISDSGTVTGKQNGAIFNFDRQINEKLDLSLELSQSKDGITDSDEKMVRASIDYLLTANSLHRSEISLISEQEEDNSIREDDVILLYRMVIQVF